MSVCSAIAVKIGVVHARPSHASLVRRTAEIFPEEEGSGEICSVSSAHVVRNDSISIELVDPDQVVCSIAIDISESQVGAITILGKLHLIGVYHHHEESNQ
jgi:hypothetical protein